MNAYKSQMNVLKDQLGSTGWHLGQLSLFSFFCRHQVHVAAALNPHQHLADLKQHLLDTGRQPLKLALQRVMSGSTVMHACQLSGRAQLL